MIAATSRVPTKRDVLCELARRHFWDFCVAVDPDFYTIDKVHLVKLCNTLEQFALNQLLDANDEPYLNLLIQMPPRHGKSRTLVNFTAWLFGRDESERVITSSYNDELAQDFSKYTRNTIQQKHETDDPSEIVYSDIFNAAIKYGDASFGHWALNGQFFSYKGSGLGGTITGKGAKWLIGDDWIKGAEEAFNENHLDYVWRWYTGTWISRKESGAHEILCMTAWAKKDPAGRLLDSEPEQWYVLQFEAYNEEQGMLCPAILSKTEYDKLKSKMDEVIFAANYHNKRIDVKGSLYGTLQTYEQLPVDSNGNLLAERKISYTDTADTGDDFLCSISAIVHQKLVYVTNVYFTQLAQEVTERETAKRIVENDMREIIIESNNGGRGFARNVEKICREELHYLKAIFTWKHQSKNKISRILTEATNVKNNIRFPVDWSVRWPEYYAAMRDYLRSGKNAHDDAPDATTGLIEHSTNNVRWGVQ